jgi:cyanophycinase
MGYLILEGGAEFGGEMSAPDLRAMELAGGFDAPVCIIPAAAAPDHNHKRAGDNGMRWFQSLGAKNVFSLDVLDSNSANDPTLAASLRTVSLVYLLGGFTRHLAETLADSLCWQSAVDVYAHGVVIAGSSAGAMVLCEYYYDPPRNRLMKGLNLMPNSCVLPHHNTFGKSWAKRLTEQIPNATLLGIDEHTGMVSDSAGGWHVHGAGEVTLYYGGTIVRYGRGARFELP